LTSLGRAGLNYRDIEIINDKNGVPTVKINKVGFDDLRIHLSLSHCKDKAIAFTIVVETTQHNKN
jgi:holo-[acyl-carrier protein] synthase